jgi:branched-chain amino acid transport system permease protein
MVGAYLSFFLVVTFHVNYFLTVAVVFGAGLILGSVVNQIVFRPLKTRDKASTLISSLGLSMLLTNLMLVAFGARPRFMSVPFAERTLAIGGHEISAQRALAFVVAGLALVLCWLWLKHTRTGKAVRAVSESDEIASLMGIDTNKTRLVTVAVSTALAAASGALFAPLFVINPFVGTMVGLKAFAVVLVGGLGRIEGAILASFALGIVESLATSFISTTYRDTIAFAILLLVLMVRPTGIVKEQGLENL